MLHYQNKKKARKNLEKNQNDHQKKKKEGEKEREKEKIRMTCILSISRRYFKICLFFSNNSKNLCYCKSFS